MYTPSLHCDWQFLWYYECIGLPAAHLDSCLIPSVWFPYPFQGDIRTSAVPYNIIISNLAKLSDWGMPLFPRPVGHRDIVCCVCKHIDHFRPCIYFPAQSLHFRFGSVAPCPTLKSDVTASTPRTRYRRLAKPYLTGFSCFILSAYKDRQNLCLSVEISYADFSARATYRICEPLPDNTLMYRFCCIQKDHLLSPLLLYIGQYLLKTEFFLKSAHTNYDYAVDLLHLFYNTCKFCLPIWQK